MTAASSNPTLIANLQGTHYGQVHMALATASYIYEGYPLQLFNTFVNFIPTLPAISDINNGSNVWNLEWGPAFCMANGSTFNDNLVAIVSNRNDSATGPVNFFAVLCRGTDVAGGISQIAEDMGAFDFQSWIDVVSGTYPVGGGMTVNPVITGAAVPTAAGNIATGSAEALITLTNLVPYNQVGLQSVTCVTPTLLNLLAANQGVPVVVTGHSPAAQSYKRWPRTLSAPSRSGIPRMPAMRFRPRLSRRPLRRPPWETRILPRTIRASTAPADNSGSTPPTLFQPHGPTSTPSTASGAPTSGPIHHPLHTTRSLDQPSSALQRLRTLRSRRHWSLPSKKSCPCDLLRTRGRQTLLRSRPRKRCRRKRPCRRSSQAWDKTKTRGTRLARCCSSSTFPLQGNTTR